MNEPNCYQINYVAPLEVEHFKEICRKEQPGLLAQAYNPSYLRSEEGESCVKGLT